MRTDDLINLLAADTPVRARVVGRGVALALAAGALASLLLLVVTVGLRHDLVSVIDTVRVAFKMGVTLLLALLAGMLVLRIARPGVPLRARVAMLLVPPILLAIGVAAEFSALPESAWNAAWLGRSAAFCLFFIPVLSLAPLAVLILALREGAPEHPALAGAAAGLAASAIGAAVYAWHCADDSPLFVATWYSLAIGLVTVAGALAGRRWLRW